MNVQDPWVSSAVLVETFQPGVSVEQFIRRPAPFNTQVHFAAAFSQTCRMQDIMTLST